MIIVVIAVSAMKYPGLRMFVFLTIAAINGAIIIIDAMTRNENNTSIPLLELMAMSMPSLVSMSLIVK